MNVNDLIEKYRIKIGVLGAESSAIACSSKWLANMDIQNGLKNQQMLLREVINDLDNVEYNRKVKVPPFMDEFLKFVKKNGDHGIDVYSNLFTICSSWPKDQILEWSFADPDRFLDAVRYGHEVDKEPKYYVRVGDKLYFKNWGEDGTCPVFEIDDAPGGVTGITSVDLQEAEMTADIIGGTVEEVSHEL